VVEGVRLLVEDGARAVLAALGLRHPAARREPATMTSSPVVRWIIVRGSRGR
jgi:hypothetical protein